MKKTTLGRRQLAAWAGMIGPALFVAVFTLEGWLRPGYSPLGMYISELSLGPRGWIQVANFIVLGVMFLVFAQGIALEFREGKASRFGPILLAIIGFSLLVSGPLVMDPAGTPRDQWSWHGTLHQIFGALVFSLAPISCFVFWRRFRSDPDWQSLQWWTLLAGILIVAAVLLLRVGPTQPPAAPNAFNAWAGLIQRTALVTYLAWIFTFALVLHRKISSPDFSPPIS